LAYFYCARNSGEQERGDPEEILRSILRQLSCPAPGFPILEAVQQKYRELRDEGFESKKLTLNETRTLILDIAQNCPRITIIVDALDECNADKLPDLLDSLKEIAEQSPNPVKIMVSSRDDEGLARQLSNSVHLHIREIDNADDIKRFVEDRVEEAISEKKLLGGKVSAKLKEHVIQTLITGAQGM
jgi:polyhydroxyalkanoate synthesis regulator phasin